jgi:hypothetical protein
VNDPISFSSLGSPAWLVEPRQILAAMLERRMLMFRPDGGPYLLTDARRATTRAFVPDDAVDFLLDRGWLSCVDDERQLGVVYLLTAEGRRNGAAARDKFR